MYVWFGIMPLNHVPFIGDVILVGSVVLFGICVVCFGGQYLCDSAWVRCFVMYNHTLFGPWLCLFEPLPFNTLVWRMWYCVRYIFEGGLFFNISELIFFFTIDINHHSLTLSARGNQSCARRSATAGEALFYQGFGRRSAGHHPPVARVVGQRVVVLWVSGANFQTKAEQTRSVPLFFGRTPVSQACLG